MLSVIQEKEFRADMMNWLAALREEEKSVKKEYKLHFSQLKVLLVTFRVDCSLQLKQCLKKWKNTPSFQRN
jgi:hypothetical protein